MDQDTNGGFLVKQIFHSTAAITLIACCLACTHSATKEQAPPQALSHEAWSRQVRSSGLYPDSVVYPFIVTTTMERWVEDVLCRGGPTTEQEKLEVLQRSLFDRSFDFIYDDELTLTAEQAFESRRGNCLSFTVLFVALARSAGIPAHLLSVSRAPDVNKQEDLVVINEHVVAAYSSLNEFLIFDFFLSSQEPIIRGRVVDDVLATAMYHNNLSGLAIRDGDLESAKEALHLTTTLAPDWPPGWINLGVARSRSSDFQGALEAYGRALEAEPGQSSALTNLAYTYRALDMNSEAATLLRSAAKGSTHPFGLIALADSEMRRGNTDEAKNLLRQARKRDRHSPEVWEAKARLARQMNEPSQADRYHAKAKKLRIKQSRQNTSQSPNNALSPQS